MGDGASSYLCRNIRRNMIVESAGFTDGKIADKYGAKGTEFGAGGMPAL